MRYESDSRALVVIEHALASSSRATRLRAVAMLARMDCREREAWLQRACRDRDLGVRETAHVVCSWVCVAEGAPWPAREDLRERDATDARLGAQGDDGCEVVLRQGRRWEYAVEVWNGDGLLVGVFVSTSFEEDDEHAKNIALGHAILASVSVYGDPFDPATAAAFVVSKTQVVAPRASDADI